ncbi:MAG: hypothetical protein AAF585_18260, partial [Verrucomicrobiota bacterium]
MLALAFGALKQKRDALMWAQNLDNNQIDIREGSPPEFLPELARNWFEREMGSSFDQVIKLNVFERQLEDGEMRHFRRLGELEELNISRSNVTDAHLANLAGCTELRLLKLYGNEVNGSGLSHLKRLTKLESLQINKSG